MSSNPFEMMEMRAELPGSPAPWPPASLSPWKPASPTFRVAPTRTAPQPPRKEKYIAIGIDFGTTYSGVSWAYSATPEEIHEVSHWPHDEQRGRDEVQIPTIMDLETKKWGFLVPKNRDPIQWFKLLLLNSSAVKDNPKSQKFLDEQRDKLIKYSGYEEQGVLNLVADFLRELWQHTLSEIGHEMEVDLLPFKVAITVPAIWPAYARQKMRDAAKIAGILDSRRIGDTTLNLVEEPEAAALSTLFDRKDHPEVEVDETFIVCDCGGGTVDITSYTVKSLNPFFRVKEAVKGDGKLCGAWLIDSSFENYMKVKAGLKFDRIDDDDLRLFMNEEWEYTLKRAFTGDEGQDSFTIRPPARVFGLRKRATGSMDTIKIPKEAIRQWYSKTYSGTRELISDQRTRIKETLGKEPRKILLVGGLGGSRYLYSMLQKQYGNVLQPRHAWSAVARGAVIAVLKNAFNPAGASLQEENAMRSLPMVMSRVARFSYGTIFGQPTSRAKPPVDRRKDRTYEDEEGIERVDRMEWYLRKGDEVLNKDPVVHEFRSIFNNQHKKAISLIIYTSDADEPPVRMDASVQKLCEIRCDDVGVAWADMAECRNKAGRLTGSRKLSGNWLTMLFEGEPKWALKAGNNTTQQSVDVEYTS